MLLDVEGVSREVRCGQSTVRKWLRSGDLPAVRLGRRVLVERAALEAFIQRAAWPAGTAQDAPEGYATHGRGA